jgi:hypothetical protein
MVSSEWQTSFLTHPRWVATNSKQAKACYMGCALWVESYGLRLFSERTTRNSQLFKLACISRLRQCRRRLETGRGTRDEGREKWEGEAPAEPERQRIATGD